MSLESNVVIAATDVVLSNATGKKWYVSKTFWANVVAGLALAAQIKWGFIIGPELQAIGMTVVNLGLRHFTTEPIIW
jgi:hypothetical protein